MNNILTLETKRYEIRLENFEGPLDLLCHLVDKNKMDIYKVNISQITDQYIEHLNTMEKMNLDIASEFLIMASTLLYIKSKGLLPNEVDDESEITEEELIRRIIEYKKYKEIAKVLKEQLEIYSKRYFKQQEYVELPKQELEITYGVKDIYNSYESILKRSEERINQNARNIDKIQTQEKYTIASKVKQMIKELMKKKKFVFNRMFSINQCPKEEVVTAFAGLLELTRRKKVIAKQEEIFGSITVEKKRWIAQ